MDTPTSPEERHAQEKMREMHDLIDLLTGWADDVLRLDNDSLMQLLRLGARVSKLLEMKNKVTGLAGRRASDSPDNPTE